MLRKALVVAYTLSIFPQPAAAAIARLSIAPGARAGGPAIAVSVPALPASRLPLTIPGASLPAPVSLSPAGQGASVSFPQAASVAAAAAAPVAAAQPLTPLPAAAKAAAAERSSEGASAAMPRLAAAGEAARSLLTQPAAGAERDSRLADFTLPARQLEGEPVAEPAEAGPAQTLAAPTAPGAPAGRVPPPPIRGARGYLLGVLGAQVANNALVVTLPLALLSLGKPLSAVAFLTTVTTGFDMAGTLISGWLTRRLTPRGALVGSTAARAGALLGAAALLASGAATVPAVIALYIVDALARGVADTARNTVPMQIAGKEKGALDRVNSLAQTAFELGGVVGPFLMIPLLRGQGSLSHWFVGAAFAAASLCYLYIPRASPPQEAPAPAAPAAASAPRSRPASRWDSLRDPALRAGIVTAVLLSLTPALRALIPAFFAESLLHRAADAAPLVLAFGAGGTAGSLVYNRLHGRLSAGSWLALSAAGAGALALAWLPGALWPMALGIFAFAFTNVMARLSVTSAIQERIPDGAEGGVMSVVRGGANLASMGLRLAIGGIVAAATDPAHAFAWIGAGVAGMAGMQLLSGRRLRAAAAAAALAAAPAPKPSPVHGMPGRLIVVEGLDGSGKSTQLERLKESLEEQGVEVVVTSWNSSELLSETVKKAKKAQALPPRTFALLNAADFSERVEKVIKPALSRGAIVLADRWYYTALARDSVRGNSPAWLRGLYKDALKPDLALYFKLPVDTAIGRVLARAEGRLGLSEDFDDEPGKKVLGQNYYAVGRDMRFAEDDRQNFRLFQTAVADQYEGQLREFGLVAMDATRSREQQTAAVLAQVQRRLGPLSAYRKAEPRPKTTIFDKDPAGDSDPIRRNYLHEKKGAHFYFRNMLLPMQERFAQLMDMSAMPTVLLHGSPHVDNYAKSAQGAAMIDFDRSRMGPYAWDLVRLLVSLSLRRKKGGDGLLERDVEKELLKGYLRGYRHPDRPFSEMRELKDIESGPDEASMTAYLAANKKWAREMRSDRLPVDDASVRRLLETYMASRGEPDLLKRYFVAEAGRGRGSMGQRAIYLVALRPRDPSSGEDSILLSFKQTRTDPDTRWYKSPFKTQNERMEKAAELYAPGWERNLGAAWLGGVEYQARAVPPLNAKLKKMLSHDQQRDLAYAVGTQLGRAHRLSVEGDPEALEQHLVSHYSELVAAATIMRDELIAAHQRYLKRMKAAGLEPAAGEDDE